MNNSVSFRHVTFNQHFIKWPDCLARYDWSQHLFAPWSTVAPKINYSEADPQPAVGVCGSYQVLSASVKEPRSQLKYWINNRKLRQSFVNVNINRISSKSVRSLAPLLRDDWVWMKSIKCSSVILGTVLLERLTQSVAVQCSRHEMTLGMQALYAIKMSYSVAR